MKNLIFREYDIRGIVGEEFDFDDVKNITKAIITYFKEKNPNTQKIIIARDGRAHSLQICNIATETALSMGLDVVDIGTCPTPVFYYSLYNLEHSTGFIITASHNPKEYNGFKMSLDKKSVSGSQIEEIKEICENEIFYENKNNKAGILYKKDITSDYIKYLTNNFKNLRNKKLNVIIDCGNGTAGPIFSRLIKEMGWQNTKLLFEEVDGNFPNHEPDPTTSNNMQALAQELFKDKNFDFGLGLDGDCDRMNPITKNGFLIPGDQLLAIYSEQVLKNFPGSSIVYDIKGSSGLSELVEKMGGKAHVSPSGHSLVKNTMLKNNAKLAGELSCHFFFNDKYFGYDDGIYASLRLFEILDQKKDKLENLLKIFPKKENSPEIRIKCEETIKKDIVKHAKDIFLNDINSRLITIDGVKVEKAYGWGLLRASNTQPVICLRFESNTTNGLNLIKKDFYKALEKYFDHELLKKYLQI